MPANVVFGAARDARQSTDLNVGMRELPEPKPTTQRLLVNCSCGTPVQPFFARNAASCLAGHATGFATTLAAGLPRSMLRPSLVAGKELLKTAQALFGEESYTKRVKTSHKCPTFSWS